ncbi:MAG: sensor histidine kinase [Actinobacteria bacterium]|nr:sensor histidine kinase [Actinomycetota bacterium]
MIPFLRSFWSEPPVAGAPRRVWRDWALVAILTAASVVEVVVRPDIPFRWLSFAVALVGIPMLLVRRTHPLHAVAVVYGAALVMDVPWLVRGADPPGLYTNAFVLLVAYALFRWGSGRQALLGLIPMVAVATLALIFDYTGPSEAIGGSAVFLLAIAAGVAMRYRTRARATKLDEIRAREREGLARDLHDTVAHHVSAIAIRAQAGLAVAATDPHAAVDALRVIDAEATRTLAEMRTIVRDLRQDAPAELAPLPGIADVRELARTSPGEPQVHVALEGDLTGVPASVGAAAYRLAQESITNARRHARRASRIDVVVRTGDDAVTVEVTDDGEVATRDGEGYGIVGMVERAERLGGTCTAGPRDGRGWTVTAVLPLRGASA